MAQVFWFVLDDARWRPLVAPVRNRREAEAVLRSMFGDRLREVEAHAKRSSLEGNKNKGLGVVTNGVAA